MVGKGEIRQLWRIPWIEIQTFIVYAKLTLVLFRKGLCGCFPFAIRVTWSDVGINILLLLYFISLCFITWYHFFFHILFVFIFVCLCDFFHCSASIVTVSLLQPVTFFNRDSHLAIRTFTSDRAPTHESIIRRTERISRCLI